MVVLSIETLRADQTALYGAPVDTMPTLGALAAEGRWFSRAWSAAPWTLPSVSSLLTGLPPSAHGVVDGGRVLPQTAQTLAEDLAARGYETAFFGVNSLFISDRGLDQGFSTYQAWGSKNGREVLAELNHFLTSRDKTRPLFLYVHLFEPHCPYEPPRPLQDRWWPPPDPTGKTLSPEQFAQLGGCFSLLDPGETPVYALDRYFAAYRAELTQADELLGELIAALKAQDLWERSLFAFLGDHGEGFWEHGDFGHGRTLYQEALAVPFVLHGPGVSPGRVDQPVSTAELASTIRRFAGLEPGPWGRDLRGALEDKPIFAETDDQGHHLWAVRSAEQKLIWDRSADTKTQHDLGKDPGELSSVATDPALLRALDEYSVFTSKQASILGIEEKALSPEVLDQLRVLGYKP